MSPSYVYNPHALPLFIAGAIVLGFGIVVRVKRNELEASKHFLSLSLGIFCWLFCTAMGYLSADAQAAMQWFRFDNAGVMFISPSFFAFSSSLTQSGKNWQYRIGYLVATILGLCSIFGVLPTVGVQRFWWGYFPQWSLVKSIPFFAFFFGYMASAFIVLQKALHSTSSEREKNQIKYVLLAFMVAYFGSIDYLATFGYSVYPIGYVPIFCLVAILFYAVVKHRLMDITVIIRKTLVYSAVTGALTLSYLLIIGIFAHFFEGLSGYKTVFSSAVAAGLITLCFQPLRKRVQTIVDSKFFRQYVDREEKLYELSREVITHTTSEAMGDALMHVIAETLHPKKGVLYLRSSQGSGFVRASGKNSNDLPLVLDEDNPLAAYFKENPLPFLLDLENEKGRSYSTRAKDDREDAA